VILGPSAQLHASTVRRTAPYRELRRCEDFLYIIKRGRPAGGPWGPPSAGGPNCSAHEDANKAQSAVSLDFALVDQESFKKYSPKSFADVVGNFLQYEEQ
jgi:hypothetical protein